MCVCVCVNERETGAGRESEGERSEGIGEGTNGKAQGETKGEGYLALHSLPQKRRAVRGRRRVLYDFDLPNVSGTHFCV